MSKPESIEQMGLVVQQIADSMTAVAMNIAMLGVEGNADTLMNKITCENNIVLNRIRQLYNLPIPPEA